MILKTAREKCLSFTVAHPAITTLTRLKQEGPRVCEACLGSRVKPGFQEQNSRPKTLEGLGTVSTRLWLWAHQNTSVVLNRCSKGQEMGKDVFQTLEENTCQPWLLYIAKLFLQVEGEIKTFQDICKEIRKGVFLTHRSWRAQTEYTFLELIEFGQNKL